MRLFDRRNNRLVYLKEKATAQFWDKHWGAISLSDMFAENPHDYWLVRLTQKHLSGGRVLEGGCGIGQNVHALHHMGYEAIGVDYASRTVAKAKELSPELDIRVGDVTRLDFPDGYFDAHWSLGVIEHFWDGYGSILDEMVRTLAPGGFVFITFPSMNPLRTLKRLLGRYDPFSPVASEPEGFYQFALNPDAVVRDFAMRGLSLKERFYTSGAKGMRDEVALLKPVLQKLYGGNCKLSGRLMPVVERILAPLAGHCTCLVLSKD